MFKELRNAKENEFYKKFDSQLTLYCFLGLFSSSSQFFDTEEELKQYVEENDTLIGDACKLEFLGNILGRSDVIKRTLLNGNTKLYTIIDEYGYAIYDYENSLYRNEAVWNFEYGDLKGMYKLLKEKGITFEDDVYQKIEDRNNYVIKKLKKRFH